MKNLKKGFTLIELLVVVAIIGILASVVLASLNNARDKGADAAIKANLSGSRAQAELFYNSQAAPTYEGVCALTGTSVIGPAVNAAEVAYDGSATAYADATASTWNTAQCHDIAGSWAAIVPLKSSTAATPASWCVDSTGASEASTVLGANATVCP